MDPINPSPPPKSVEPVLDPAPPRPADDRQPRRSPLEVAALFVGILLLLFVWWRVQNPVREKRSAAIAETMTAERTAQMALSTVGLPAPGKKMGPLWRQAKEDYRSALEKDPRLPRARRGLAAMVWLEGDRQAARKLMSSPANVPAEGRIAWRATQAAFGAIPRPQNPKTLEAYRAALQNVELGWPRYAALWSLSQDPSDAARYDVALRSGTRGSPLTAAMSATGILLLLAGLVTLQRVIKDPPPNRLKPIHAPTGSLVSLSVISLFVSQLPALFILMSPSGARAQTDAHRMIWVAAVSGVLGTLAMYWLASVLLRSVGSSLGEIGWRVRGALKWSVGGYLAMLPPLAVAAVISSVLYMAFPNVPTPENPASGMALAAKGPEVLVVLLFASVAAPLAEEFMMRGLLFRGLAQRYGVTVGALASSMVFAGLHPQLPAGFLPIFVIGVALCYIYRSSGSLVPAVIVHGISNMVVLLFVRAGMG